MKIINDCYTGITSLAFLPATYIKKCIAIGLFFSLLPVAVAEASECSADSLVSASAIVDNAASICCNQRPGKRRRCLRQSVRSVRGVGPVVSRRVVRPAVQTLQALRKSSCDFSLVETLECTDALSSTIEEAVGSIERKACDLRFKSDRRDSLKKLRRKVRKARRYVGTDFFKLVRADVKNLMRSEACGAGGETINNGCTRVVNPRDGANTGNVYKLSDHSPHNPVFITHNGSRSGTAITPTGVVLDTLKYSGLANPDPAGLRHHYRFNRSCNSLPAGFYIKLGGTCYEIDSPCSRID